jgi:hypothetical protein
MKKQYELFISLIQAGDRDAVYNFLGNLSSIQASALVFLSQRSAVPEHAQLVGDFILTHFGDSPTQGISNLWG